MPDTHREHKKLSYFPETGITKDCLWTIFWKLNQGPLEEYSVLLTDPASSSITSYPRDSWIMCPQTLLLLVGFVVYFTEHSLMCSVCLPICQSICPSIYLNIYLVLVLPLPFLLPSLSTFLLLLSLHLLPYFKINCSPDFCVTYSTPQYLPKLISFNLHYMFQFLDRVD